MIANDRFPDLPMATTGTNPWHDESLGAMTPAADQIQHGQNMIVLGPDGGMEWQRMRPSGNGTFHQPDTIQPTGTTVRRG